MVAKVVLEGLSKAAPYVGRAFPQSKKLFHQHIYGGPTSLLTYGTKALKRIGATTTEMFSKGRVSSINPVNVVTKNIKKPKLTKTGKHKVVKGKKQFDTVTVTDRSKSRQNQLKDNITDKVMAKKTFYGTAIYGGGSMLFGRSTSGEAETMAQTTNNQDNVKNNVAPTQMVNEMPDAKPQSVIVEKNVATDNKNLIKGSGSFVLDTSDKQTIKPYYTGIDPRNQAYNKLQREVTRPQDVRMLGQKRSLLRNA
jgi:hypothetical protein